MIEKMVKKTAVVGMQALDYNGKEQGEARYAAYIEGVHDTLSQIENSLGYAYQKALSEEGILNPIRHANSSEPARKEVYKRLADISRK